MFVYVGEICVRITCIDDCLMFVLFGCACVHVRSFDKLMVDRQMSRHCRYYFESNNFSLYILRYTFEKRSRHSAYASQSVQLVY